MKNQIIFTSFLLAILGSLILQSQYYSGDMIVHTQFIKQIADPGLLNDDYINIYSIPQKSSSLYYPLMAKITKSMPFDSYTDFRIMYFIYLNILFSGLLFVTYELLGSLTVGVFWILLLMTKVHIGGAAIETIDTDVVPRALSAAFIVWSYFLHLKKKHKPKVVFVMIAIAFHVLTGFYVLYYFFLKTVLQLLNRQAYKVIGLMILGLSILFIYISSNTELNKYWLFILRLRNEYAFLDLWSLTDWRNLVILLMPGVLSLHWLPSKWHRVKRLFKFLVFGSLLISIVHIVFTTFLPQWLVIVLQLGRVWIFPVYVSLFLGSGLTEKFITNKKIKVVTLLTFSACLCLYVVPKHTIGRESWIEVQKWAKSNTGTSCVFLTPFYNTGFRVESDRAIVGDMKDGTLSFYSENFAYEWKRRYDKLNSWETLSSGDLNALQKEFGFDYVITNKMTRYSMQLLFENEDYSVYKVASTHTCQK